MSNQFQVIIEHRNETFYLKQFEIVLLIGSSTTTS